MDLNFYCPSKCGYCDSQDPLEHAFVHCRLAWSAWRHFEDLLGIPYYESCPKPTAVAWHRPPVGCFKLNVDGSALGCQGHSAGGGILRNSEGNPIFAVSMYFGIATNMEPEARALLEGLRLGIHKNILVALIELDSLMLHNVLHNAAPILWKIDHIVREIFGLLGKFFCF
ncbi:hypothetical protein ACH5RR_001285 [Cinchona calisaya]|uniref:RNase H type-1 domain-containing protein n=1 Tax=Cinchona calisaya TaxID=153742 RepID=A0ABD3B468_9GENT